MNVTLLKPFDSYSSPSKIVLSLIDGLYNQGHKVVLDNYYISPVLLRTLLHNGTDSFGTVRRRHGLPSGFWDWKPLKSYLNPSPPMVQFCRV